MRRLRPVFLAVVLALTGCVSIPEDPRAMPALEAKGGLSDLAGMLARWDGSEDEAVYLARLRELEECIRKVTQMNLYTDSTSEEIAALILFEVGLMMVAALVDRRDLMAEGKMDKYIESEVKGHSYMELDWAITFCREGAG